MQLQLGLRERQVLLDEVNKDPYGSIARALQMPEDSPQRQILLAGASAAVGKQNYDRAIQEAELAKSNAQRELALAQAAKLARGEISETIITEDGRPLTKRGEKLYTMDGRVYEGKVKRLAAPSPYADLLATPPGTTAPAKPTGTPIYNPQTGKIEYKQ